MATTGQIKQEVSPSLFSCLLNASATDTGYLKVPSSVHFEVLYPVGPVSVKGVKSLPSLYMYSMWLWRLNIYFDLKTNKPNLRVWGQNFSPCDLEDLYLMSCRSSKSMHLPQHSLGSLLSPHASGAVTPPLGPLSTLSPTFHELPGYQDLPPSSSFWLWAKPQLDIIYSILGLLPKHSWPTSFY